MCERPRTPTTLTSLLSVDRLSVTYVTRNGTVAAVRNVSLEILPGETFGLVGESGSGKSTVAMAIMNYLGPSARTTGDIRYRSKQVLGLSPRALRELRGAQIAMVYQDPMSSLNPAIRVGDQIGEVLRLHQGLSREEAFVQALEMMRRTQIPDAEVNAHKYPHQLSGGMQQRVVISMALINNPDLLILDEPTTGLDVTTEATILDLVADLRTQFQTAILFITHDLGVVAQVCDRIGVMYAGELLESGTTSEIFAHPRHPYTLALMSAIPRPSLNEREQRLNPIPGRLPDLRRTTTGCSFSPRCRFAREICVTSHPLMRPVSSANHQSACHFSETLPNLQQMKREGSTRVRVTQTKELLHASSLKVHFAERSLWDALTRKPVTAVRAVDGISLMLHHGETVGLVGESGSGKTTLGKALVGLHNLTSGSLTFEGKELTQLDPKAFRKRVQFIFQNPDSSLNPRKRVGNIIARPLRLYGLSPAKEIQDRVSQLLDLVNLRPEYAYRFPHELSGGEKQRIGIARAFAAAPDVIIADEPLSALDVSVQASILNLLIDLQARFGTAYVFISHDLNTVRWLCDRVVVMYLGSVYEVGSVDQVFAPPYHPYTEALLSAIPVPDPAVRQERILLTGTIPSPRHPPAGCKFHTRCPRKIGSICELEAPPQREVAPGHVICCHHAASELMNDVFAPVATVEPANVAHAPSKHQNPAVN